MLRVGRAGLPEELQRLVELPLVPVGGPEVRHDVRVVRVELQRLLVGVGRLRELAGVVGRVSEVDEGVVVARLRRDDGLRILQPLPGRGLHRRHAGRHRGRRAVHRRSTGDPGVRVGPHRGNGRRRRVPSLEGDPRAGEADERPEGGEEDPVAPAGSRGGGGAGLALLSALSPGRRALLGRRGKVIVVAQGEPPSSSSSGSSVADQVPATGPTAGAMAVASHVPVIRFASGWTRP